MAQEPLKLSQWCRLAEKRNLWLTQDKVENVKKDESLCLAVGISSGSRSMDFKDGEVHTAQEYFELNKEKFTRKANGYELKDDEYKENPFYDDGNGLACLGGEASCSMLWSSLSSMPPIIHFDDEDSEEDEGDEEGDEGEGDE